MAISRRATGGGANEFASGKASLAITTPISVAASDILIACISQSGAAGQYTPPSGWTLIGQMLTQGGANALTLQVFWSLGSNVNFTFTGGNAANTVGYLTTAWIGVDNNTPIDATGTVNSNNGVGTIAANSVTIATVGALEMVGMADFNSGTISATGWSARNNGESIESAFIIFNNTPAVATGATGTVTITNNAATAGQTMIAVPFALRPFVAVLPTPTPTSMNIGGGVGKLGGRGHIGGGVSF